MLASVTTTGHGTSPKKLPIFCSYFVHQDGSVGGQYGSRNTEYFLLSPLCLLADRSAIARAMLRRLRTGDGGVLAWYKAFDDRYLCHNMLHSLLRAVRYAPKDEGEECLPVIVSTNDTLKMLGC